MKWFILGCLFGCLWGCRGHQDIETVFYSSVKDFETNLLLQDHQSFHSRVHHVHVNSTKTFAHQEVIEQMIDHYLSVRPWWRLVDLDLPGFIFSRASREFIPIYKAISHTQNPKNCSQTPIRIKTLGMDSYGNSAYDFSNDKERDFWRMYVPYITHPDYLDPQDCPQGGNYWNCIFLPSSICQDYPQPIRDGIFQGVTAGSAELTPGNDILDERIKSSLPSFTLPSMKLTVYGETFVTGKTQMVTNEMNTVSGTIFTYGYLFRMNSRFRSLVKLEMERIYSASNLPFPSNGDCVSIHIRRSHDRAPPGIDINEWCRLYHQEGDKWLAWDFAKKQYYEVDDGYLFDYGCDQGMPFGAISLDQYLNASQIISKSKNLYIRTDNPKWLQDELKKSQLKDQFNIFTSHVYENHRKGSIRNAASYFAAIEIARKCPAFVGHQTSAVTSFWLRHLCIYHAGKFGSCPILYDFAMGPQSWKIGLK
jgi:hypothetical protein